MLQRHADYEEALVRVAELEQWQREAVEILGGVRNYDVIQRLLAEAQAGS